MALLDWGNPPRLRARKMEMAKTDIEARDRAAARVKKGPKNHGVNRDRAKAAAKKAWCVEMEAAVARDVIAEFKSNVRQFYRGERDTYPNME